MTISKEILDDLLKVERMNRTIKEGEAVIEIDPVNRFPADRQTLPLR